MLESRNIGEFSGCLACLLLEVLDSLKMAFNLKRHVMLNVSFEFIFVLLEPILRPLKLVLAMVDDSAELKLDLTPHFLLHEVVIIFEGAQFSTSHIVFVDHSVTFGRQLSIDDGINVHQELFTLSFVINPFHLFYVDQMAVLVLPNSCSFRSGSHFSLSVLEQLLAEDL
jgi:hypothetical protein